MNPLQAFYENPTQREAVKEFLLEVLKERAIEKVFSARSVAGIYETKSIIESAFDKLEEVYKPKKKPTNHSSR